ncbi:MAG: hypothetical protein HRU20_11605 [Pseudomonadales bacterium]|nr:hypothetical protein [Pseudomonadales bacterium]
MVESTDSDIIQSLSLHQHGDKPLQLLHFRDGKVLVLSQDTLAFYKDEKSIDDALGGGLIAMVALKPEHHLSATPEGWVNTFKAGFVGLDDDKALLITPLAIQLFAHKQDALYNRNEIARLDIPA